MPSIKAALSASAIALMASAANAHMVMVTPPPYGTPDNSPLDAAGANFPCKATSNSGGTVTNMAIGSQQQLVFKGEAVHGGGSCQVSLTTDNPATKNSHWMVIHSIVGGCPARDAAGNLGGDNNANEIDPDTYNYTIPDGITPGTYTLAWTWFNKIGNREMYMNCANVKITGGSGKRDVYVNETDEFVHPELSVRASSFPPMFVANIPTTDCETVDSENVLFPDPGASVESAAAGSSNLPVAPTGPKCGSSGAAAPAATGSAPAGSGAASPAASPAASAASPDSQSAAGGASAAVTPAPSTGASAAAPDSQSAAAPAVVASPAASAAAPTSAAAAPAAPAATGVSSSSGSSASTGTCTQPGQSICSPDGLQIGTCTESNTVTWIPVASGTKCVGGYMVAAKRSPKFAENYVRRAM